MASTWKTVRVFISSTFRDMHAERDHLVKVVFPALRERLEKHRVLLIDIDLRWGVTKEQAENDQVLGLCLKLIDECRPFFVGILGERYGWVPTRYPADALKKYGWIENHTGKSVTELEIIHGVLQNPQMRGHAFFYFRDPNCLQAVPEAQWRSVYAETDATLIEKLAELKKRIRFSGHAQTENYPARWNPEAYDRPSKSHGRLVGLEEFGRRVQQQLWDAISAELKLEEVPAPAAAVDPLAEEADFHERFMESRLRVYVGRKDLRNQIVKYADGTAITPCLVSGASGSGKSAAMARFVRVYRHARRDTIVIPHFVGASPRSTGLRDMLRRFCHTLKNALNLPDEVPEETTRLMVAFRDLLGKVPAERRVLIVIDALNQLDETERAQHLEWLPAKLLPHVKIVVSCISDSDKPEPALEAFRHRPHQRIEVQPLPDAERRAIIREVPSLSAKTLDEMQIGLLLSNPATENPLFLLVALEELRGFGSFEQLDEKMVKFPHPLEQEPRWRQWLLKTQANARNLEAQARSRGDDVEAKKWLDQLARLERISSMLETITTVGDTVTAIFTQVIVRLEEDFDPETAQAVVTLLASARRGLSERELQELLANVAGRDELFPILRQLRPYLLSRGGLLDFYHRNLFKAVREKYLTTDAACTAAHARLAGYFYEQNYWLEVRDEQRKPPRTAPPMPRAANLRKVDELPWQRLQAQQWNELADLLLTLQFLEAKATAHMVDDLIQDFSAFLNNAAAPPDEVRDLATIIVQESYSLSERPHLTCQQIHNVAFLMGREVDRYARAAVASLHPIGLIPLLVSESFSSRDSGPSSRLLGRHDRPVHAVAVCPSGQWVASGAYNKHLKVFSLTGCEKPIEIPLQLPIEHVSFVPRYPWVVVATRHGQVVLVDVSGGDVTPLGRLPGRVHQLLAVDRPNLCYAHHAQNRLSRIDLARRTIEGLAGDPTGAFRVYVIDGAGYQAAPVDQLLVPGVVHREAAFVANPETGHLMEFQAGKPRTCDFAYPAGVRDVKAQTGGPVLGILGQDNVLSLAVRTKSRGLECVQQVRDVNCFALGADGTVALGKSNHDVECFVMQTPTARGRGSSTLLNRLHRMRESDDARSRSPRGLAYQIKGVALYAILGDYRRYERLDHRIKRATLVLEHDAIAWLDDELHLKWSQWPRAGGSMPPARILAQLEGDVSLLMPLRKAGCLLVGHIDGRVQLVPHDAGSGSSQPRCFLEGHRGSVVMATELDEDGLLATVAEDEGLNLYAPRDAVTMSHLHPVGSLPLPAVPASVLVHSTAGQRTLLVGTYPDWCWQVEYFPVMSSPQGD